MSLKKMLFAILLAFATWAVIAFWKGLPPFGSRHQPEAAQKETKAFPDKPPFRFSSRTLAKLCDEYGMDTAAMVWELERFGIEARPEWPIKRIAEENDMEPHSVFDVLRQLKE